MVRRTRTASERRFRRLGFSPVLARVAGYIGLLAVWLIIAYDTLGTWQRRQELVYRSALAAWTAAQPTVAPSAEPALAPLATPVPAAPTATALPMPASLPPRASAIAALDPRPALQSGPKTGRSIAAWVPASFDALNARPSFEANKDLLDEISPFWYTVAGDGSLLGDEGSRDAALVGDAHAAGVLVLPTIHNTDGPEWLASLLRDDNLRTRHVQAIVAEVREHNYDGIDIDYESLAPELRGPFSAFMQQLGDALHADGKLLTVAAHAKTADFGGLGGFQDWALLGQVCDRVRIMTYDYHWRGGGPGPIAPLGWVRSVAEYGRSVMPSNKLQLGIAFYGYNWGPGGDAISMTWNEIQALIEQHRPEVNLAARDADGPIEESWFRYRDRTVWYSDHRSLEPKLRLVDELDLAGIAIWRLGDEDPRNWEVVRDQLVRSAAVIRRVVDSQLPEH